MFIQSVNNIKLITDTGIYFEMKDFFSSQSGIFDINITVSNLKYNIDFTMSDFDVSNAKKLLHSFIAFIQYPYLTCYKRNIESKKIVYELITADENMKGFYCKINIK